MAMAGAGMPPTADNGREQWREEALLTDSAQKACGWTLCLVDDGILQQHAPSMQACVLLKRAKDAVDRFQDSMPDLLLSRPHCYDLQVRFGGVDQALVVSTILRVSLFKGDGSPVTAATCDSRDRPALSGETTFHVL